MRAGRRLDASPLADVRDDECSRRVLGGDFIKDGLMFMC